MLLPAHAWAQSPKDDIILQPGGGRIPPTVIEPLRLPAMPLRAQDRWIVDSTGTRVKLASANWFGGESPEHVVGGLEKASLDLNHPLVAWTRLQLLPVALVQ